MQTLSLRDVIVFESLTSKSFFETWQLFKFSWLSFSLDKSDKISASLSSIAAEKRTCLKQQKQTDQFFTLQDVTSE